MCSCSVSLLSISETHAENKLLVKSSNRTNVFALRVAGFSVCLSLQGFTSQQMSMVEHSTVMIEEREKEIRSIVQSISEINEMYRDLATMIVDQVKEYWVSISLQSNTQHYFSLYTSAYMNT